MRHFINHPFRVIAMFMHLVTLLFILGVVRELRAGRAPVGGALQLLLFYATVAVLTLFFSLPKYTAKFCEVKKSPKRFLLYVMVLLFATIFVLSNTQTADREKAEKFIVTQTQESNILILQTLPRVVTNFYYNMGEFGYELSKSFPELSLVELYALSVTDVPEELYTSYQVANHKALSYYVICFLLLVIESAAVITYLYMPLEDK